MHFRRFGALGSGWVTGPVSSWANRWTVCHFVKSRNLYFLAPGTLSEPVGARHISPNNRNKPSSIFNPDANKSPEGAHP